MVTSRRALDAALVLDNLTTHEDNFSCDRDGMPTCSHVAQPVCPQVPCDVHTNTATLMLGLAQPSEWDDRNQVRNEGDTDSASLEQRAMYEHVARERDCGWESTAQQAHSIPLLPTLLPACCHCLALPAMPHFTLLLPAMPGPCPSAALYTGRREIPRLARPAWPLSPALCVCVCWVCDAPVPVDAPLAFGLDVACYAVASALFRPLLCLCSRIRFRMLMWVVARPAAFVCEVLCTLYPCWSWWCVGYDRVGYRLLFGCFHFRLRRPVFSPITPYTTHHTLTHHATSAHLIHHTPRIPH